MTAIADDAGSPLITARRAADLDGQLTHDGVAGERSDLCDLRPVVMAAPGFGDTAMTQASALMHVLEDGLISIFARCLLTAPIF